MRKLREQFQISYFFLILALVSFLLLRFPSLFEPYWYGDEGIYQVIGMALNNGREMYVGIWDNKPPLLFFIYALLQGSQFAAKLASLLVGFIILLLFFGLSKHILKKPIQAGITTLVFAILFGTPYLEGNIANTENFMLLPILGGILLSYLHLSREKTYSFIRSHPYLTLSGIGFLFGLSFSMKVVGVFEFAAVSVMLLFYRKTLFDAIKQGLALTLGFITPITVFTIFYAAKGLFLPYMQSVLYRNISYVGIENHFLFPQGLLVLKLVLLFSTLLFLYIYKKRISFNLTFLIIWLAFALYSSFLSHRSYTHYLLLSLPSLVLLGSYFFTNIKTYRFHLLVYAGLVTFLLFHFKPYPLLKTFSYYGNFFSYITGMKDITSYQTFFDSRVPRDYKIASYLEMKLDPYDVVFIWSNSAQIYALSQTLPVGRYAAAYHVISNEAEKETMQAIDEKQPRFIVVTDDEPMKDIFLADYMYRATLENATIYERTN